MSAAGAFPGRSLPLGGTGAAAGPLMTAAYPLVRGAAEHGRLALQAAFWAPDAHALFAAAGVARGMHVADLGCGTPHVAQALAGFVGPAGCVYALDDDAALVDAMRAEPGSVAVTPVKGDAYALPWPDATLDAVHARFLAAPCGRLEALVAEMRRVLRPGGLLMLQEPDSATWRIDAAGAAWPRVHSLIRDAFRRRGGDFDVGASLHERLAPHLADVRVREVAHVLPATHAYAALPLGFADSLEPLWRREGWVSEPELRALRRALAAAFADESARVRTFRLVQLWGRKRDSA